MSAEMNEHRALDLSGITSVEAATFNGGVTVLAGEGPFTLDVTLTGKATYEVERLGTLLYVAGKKRGLTYMGSSVSFSLRLPPDLALKLSSLNAPVRVQGPVRSLNASTYRGDIMAARTGAGTLKLSSADGAIHVDGARGRVEVSTSKGDIALSHVTGTMRVSTAYGDVEIADAEGPMNLSIALGAARIHGGRGNIQVATGKGDIEVTATEGQLQLVTGYGVFHLERITLPPGSRNWAKTGSGSAELMEIHAPGGLRLRAKVSNYASHSSFAFELPGYLIQLGRHTLSAELPGPRQARLEIVAPSGLRITG
jgi:hypothetical protein